MKATKKLGAMLIGMALAFQVIGCGDAKPAVNAGRTQAGTSVSADSEARQDSENSQENTSVVQNTGEDQQQTETGTPDTGEDSRILIAYFTAGENSDVDVVSSASVTTVDGEAKGRLRAVADMIQAGTGGTLFSIQTAGKYPGDGGALIDYAAQEQDANVITDGFTVNERDVADASGDVADWLRGLGY